MEMLDMKTFAGQHIAEACKEAIALADEKKQPVRFTFNETPVTVHPGENPDDVVKRWDADREAAYQKWINSDEYKEQERKRAEDEKRERERVIAEPAKTEQQMREAKVPWPKNEKQLTEYIHSLTNRQHDYSTLVYAMSMAAEAAFNYVAGMMGATGFQASCADLDFVRRTRRIDGPFMLLKGADLLYPQYDLRAKLEEAIEQWRPWVKEQAQKKLNESNEHTHPDVIEHWMRLAE